DVLLDRAPAGAAVLLRPVRRHPALAVQRRLPLRDILAIQVKTLGLAPRQLRRQVVPQEGAHLGAERFVLRAEGQLHQACTWAAVPWRSWSLRTLPDGVFGSSRTSSSRSGVFCRARPAAAIMP